MKYLGLPLLLVLLALPGTSVAGPRTERVTFAPGADSAVITGRITGDDYVLYQVNARDGQFLQVSLRPDNQSADYNIYIPGRGPGDEALFNSAAGGREYTGQLYVTGDHAVSVFLNRNAAREGQVANYDIVFRVTDAQPGPLPAEVPTSSSSSGATASTDDPWTRVSLENADHGPLLERQAGLPSDLRGASPVFITLFALEPALAGIVTSVAASYDTMENPAEGEITVTEGGILDDDLFGIRHRVSLLRTSNNQWRVVGYARGELRRAHLR